MANQISHRFRHSQKIYRVLGDSFAKFWPKKDHGTSLDFVLVTERFCDGAKGWPKKDDETSLDFVLVTNLLCDGLQITSLNT